MCVVDIALKKYFKTAAHKFFLKMLRWISTKLPMTNAFKPGMKLNLYIVTLICIIAAENEASPNKENGGLRVR